MINNCLAKSYKHQVGKINYEIKNHLGNVCSVVRDVKKYDMITKTSSANLMSMTNYDAFGMEMPGNVYFSDSYSYGYNGKVKDNELKGEGNSIDYGARIYDPRLGRWLSNDPLQEEYPDLSPYNYVANNPINNIDPDGKKIVFGSDCSQKFKIYFKMAIKRLEENRLDDPYKFLENSSATYVIHEIKDKVVFENNKMIQNNCYNGRNCYVTRKDGRGGHIFWLPLTGFFTTNNQVMSPIVMLQHEMGHAVQDEISREHYLKASETPDPDFENLAEKEVIQNMEWPTAEKLGEVVKDVITRNDHGLVDEGEFQLKSPTSPLPKPIDIWNKIKKVDLPTINGTKSARESLKARIQRISIGSGVTPILLNPLSPYSITTDDVSETHKNLPEGQVR